MAGQDGAEFFVGLAFFGYGGDFYFERSIGHHARYFAAGGAGHDFYIEIHVGLVAFGRKIVGVPLLAGGRRQVRG